MPTEVVVPVERGAEAFVELLNAHGVDCIVLNSGTDTFPVQEAISKFSAQGRRTPRIIVCPDELGGNLRGTRALPSVWATSGGFGARRCGHHAAGRWIA